MSFEGESKEQEGEEEGTKTRVQGAKAEEVHGKAAVWQRMKELE